MDALILMDIDQVAAMFHVKPRTIRYWVQHERFPEPVRNGKKPLWLPAEIEAHLLTIKLDKPVIRKSEPQVKRGRGPRTRQSYKRCSRRRGLGRCKKQPGIQGVNNCMGQGGKAMTTNLLEEEVQILSYVRLLIGQNRLWRFDSATSAMA